MSDSIQMEVDNDIGELTIETEPGAGPVSAGASEIAIEPASVPQDTHDPAEAAAAALRESQRAITEQQARIEEIQRERQTAQEEIARMRQRLVDVDRQRQAERKAALQAEIDAAEMQRATATAAYRAAREAGDLDNEVAANELLAASISAKREAETRLRRLEEGPVETASPAGNSNNRGDGLDEVTRRWIAEHPRFNTDTAYRAVAMGAEAEAVTLGMARGSQSYFNHINSVLQARFKETGMINRGGGTAAPPSRHGASGSAPSIKIPFQEGEIAVYSRGGKDVSVIPPYLRDQFNEFAQINGLTPEKYLRGLIDMARDNAAGRPSELRSGSGAVYRTR